jgi:hypothetical protein
MAYLALIGWKSQSRRLIHETGRHAINGLLKLERGDRIWVREKWAVSHKFDHLAPSLIPNDARVHYAASESLGGLMHRNPRHMPRWASRFSLEIKKIYSELLQNISVEDVRKEGLQLLSKDYGRTFKYGIPDWDERPTGRDIGWPWEDWSSDPKKAFRTLWERENGTSSWDKNPYVFVIEFVRIE